MPDIKGRVSQSGLLKGSAASQNEIVASKVEVNTAGINIGDLIDVTITSPADGSYVVYQSSSNTFLDDQTITKTSTGINITGRIDVGGTTILNSGLALYNLEEIKLADNIPDTDSKKLRFGADNDLEIYHDGTNSHIKNTGSLYVASEAPGDLYLRSDDDIFIQGQGGENSITVTGNAGITLYHDASPMLVTTATGIDVTGTVQADGLTLDDGDIIYQGGGNWDLKHNTASQNIVFSTTPTGGSTPERRMRITHDGKVGIGTDSPKQQLHISGGTASGDVTKVAIGATGSNAETHLQLAERFTGNDMNYGFSFVTDGNDTNNLLIKNHDNSTTGDVALSVARGTGNVGIGTSSPDEKLHIEGNLLIDSANQSETEGGIFFREGSTDTNKYNLSILTYDHNGNFPDGLSINAFDGVSFCTGSNSRQERMRIDSSGKVGIGTDNPQTILDVNGGYINLADGTYSASMGRGNSLISGQTASDFVIAATGSTDLVLSTGSADRLHIDSSGKVGIGTDSPATALDVDGTATATTFSGDLNGTINTATTATTQAATDNSTKVATTAYVKTAVSDLVGGAGEALDTLNELATALGNDANFSNTITTALGNRLRVDVNNQSLDATQKANAIANLGLGTAATTPIGDYATAAQGLTADAALQPAGTLTGKIQTTQTDNNMSGLTINAGAAASGSIIFKEGSDNGTNTLTLKGAASLENDVTITLPSATGTVITTGNTADDLTEGSTNVYYTDARVDTKLSTGVGNIITTGYLRGPAAFYIDPASDDTAEPGGATTDTGEVQILGDLKVTGANFNAAGLNLTLAKGSANKAGANGAGITIDCGTDADATITYVSADDHLASNKSVDITGNLKVSGTFKDSSGDTGTNGQVLLSTGTGTNWGTAASTLTLLADDSSDADDSIAIDLLTEKFTVAGGTGIDTSKATDNQISVALETVTGLSAGQYGAAGTIPQITVDATGRVTAISTVTGQTGPMGPSGATTFSYLFNTDTSFVPVNNPGTAKIKVDNANLTLATKIGINHEMNDTGTTDIEDFLDTVIGPSSTVKGHVKLSKQSDPSQFVLYQITGGSNWEGNNRILITYLAGNITSFNNNEEIFVSFSRTGDAGSGSGGGGGTAGLVQDTDGDTKIQVEESADEDIIRFDIGGTELMTLDADELELKSTDLKLTGSGEGADLTSKIIPDSSMPASAWQKHSTEYTELSPMGVHFNSDGTKAIVTHTASGGHLSILTLSSPFLLTNANITKTSQNSQIAGTSSADFITGIETNSDGTIVYFAYHDTSDDTFSILKYTPTSAYDANMGTQDAEYATTIATSGMTATSLAFKSDGSRLYVGGTGSAALHVGEWNLSTNYDISTATSSGTLTSPNAVVNFTNVHDNSQGTAPQAISDLAFSSDGESLYVLDKISARIYSYILSTAWSISTATHNGTMNIKKYVDDGARGLHVDTTNNFVALAVSGKILRFTLDHSVTSIDTSHIKSGGTLSVSGDLNVDGDLISTGSVDVSKVTTAEIAVTGDALFSDQVVIDAPAATHIEFVPSDSGIVNTSDSAGGAPDFAPPRSIKISAGHGIKTGDEILYDKNGNTAIGNLGGSQSRLYKHVRVTGNFLQFYSSKANALADSNRINISTTPTGTHIIKRLTDEIRLGSTTQKSEIIIGRAFGALNQTNKISIGTGQRAAGATLQIDLGAIDGSTGSNTLINIGSQDSQVNTQTINIGGAANITGTQPVTVNGSFSVTPGATVSRTITLGSAAQTGAITVGQSTKTNTINIGDGATESGQTQTINIGTSGVSGSTTTIKIGKFTIPAADGSANQVLKTDGNGNLAFVDQSSGGVTFPISATMGASGSQSSQSILSVSNDAEGNTGTIDHINIGNSGFDSDVKVHGQLLVHQDYSSLNSNVTGIKLTNNSNISTGTPSTIQMATYNTTAEMDFYSGSGTGSTVAFKFGQNSEKFKFTPSGRLGIGVTQPLQELHIAGDILATGNITAFYSDERLKNLKGAIPNALEKVNQLTGYYYTANDLAHSLGVNNTGLEVGVSAQEVESVLPEVVVDSAVGMSEFGENYKTVQYDRLTPLLIESIKELTQKVAELEAKIKEMGEE